MVWPCQCGTSALKSFGSHQRSSGPPRLSRLVPLGEIAVAVDAIDPRQNFGHAGEQLRGHFAADFPVLEQHPRERLVFHDRHLMLRGNLADFLRVKTDALGDALRSEEDT